MSIPQAKTLVPQRRWFQFRLLTLFVFTGLAAVVFACFYWWPVRREIEALRHGNAKQRHEAAEALALMGPKAKAAIGALIDALEYEDDYEEAYHQFFYEGYAGPTVEPRLTITPLSEALAGIGAQAIDDLVAAMKHHEDEDVRRGCAAALAEIEPTPQDAIPHLMEALEDRHWGVREQAAYSLLYMIGDSDPKRVAPLATELLSDDHVYVRFAAVNILWHLGPFAKEAVPDLVYTLTDEDDSVRDLAGMVLAEIDPKTAQKELDRIAADEEEDRDVRDSARNSLHYLQN